MFVLRSCMQVWLEIKKAFLYIELFLVMAIIALEIGIIIPEN